MKKTTLFFLCLTVVLSLFAFAASAAEIMAEGVCGKVEGCGSDNSDAVVWTLTDDMTLTLTGQGEVNGYGDMTVPPWYDWRDEIKTVVIETGVTALNSGNFMNCTALTTVTLPDTLTAINGAFTGCTALETVAIPGSVTEIGASAFSNCTALKAVTLPESVTAIGSGAFAGCTSLESFNIPAAVKVGSNGYVAFLTGCKNLKTITVSDGNTDFSADSQGVLYNSDMTALYQAPGGLTGYYAVADTAVKIQSGAFRDCGVESVALPDTLETLESYVFQNCAQLREVRIPAGVTEIADSVFSGCTSLERFAVDSDNNTFKTDETGVLFTADMTTLLWAPARLTGDYAIPDSVTTVARHAFGDCALLANLRVPAGVTALGDQSSYLYGASIFSGCTALEGIWVDADNAVYKSDEKGVLYSADIKTLIHFPAMYEGDYTLPATVRTMNRNAFAGSENLGAIWVEEGNTTFSGDEAGALMRGTELVRVPPKTAGEYTIPEKVTTVMNNAFADCNSITAVHITKNVKSITALPDCTALEKITVADENQYLTADEQGVLYDKAVRTMICIPAAYEGEYALPYTVRMVYMSGVKNASNLTALIFTGSRPDLASYDLQIETPLRYPANLNSWQTQQRYTNHLNWQPYNLNYTPGDINRDNSLTNADLVTLARYIASLYNYNDTPYTLTPDFGDMNKDGTIDNADLVALARAIVE